MIAWIMITVRTVLDVESKGLYSIMANTAAWVQPNHQVLGDVRGLAL
jgi:hypothetical protein